jgi:uncharacterized phage protein (TIGR01671 family)
LPEFLEQKSEKGGKTMREILFRGKRKDNGEWVCGDLVKHYENQRRFIACDQLAFTYSECGIDRLVTERFYEVIPETVGQYTGLKDKNGKEIYEGDVVHCVSQTDMANMVIIWEEGEFHMVLCEKFKNYIPLCGFYCIRNFTKEVISNIHDNPELMEAAP